MRGEDQFLFNGGPWRIGHRPIKGKIETATPKGLTGRRMFNRKYPQGPGVPTNNAFEKLVDGGGTYHGDFATLKRLKSFARGKEPSLKQKSTGLE